MNTTINASAISRVTIKPISESDYWTIMPASEEPVSFYDDVFDYFTGKKITLPERVQYEYGSLHYSLDEFEAENDLYFIKDGKVFDKAVVTMYFIGGGSNERYFRETTDAVKFYDEVVMNMSNRVRYSE